VYQKQQFEEIDIMYLIIWVSLLLAFLIPNGF